MIIKDEFLHRCAVTENYEQSAVELAKKSFNICEIEDYMINYDSKEESTIYRQWLITVQLPKLGLDILIRNEHQFRN